MTIDSYSANWLTGQSLNKTCADRADLEYANCAHLIHRGKPKDHPFRSVSTPSSPGPRDLTKVAFLNPGDHYTVTIHDTAHGLQTVVYEAAKIV